MYDITASWAINGLARVSFPILQSISDNNCQILEIKVEVFKDPPESIYVAVAVTAIARIRFELFKDPTDRWFTL